MRKTVVKLSSLSKKFFMAFAGLFLISFLVVHLGINLFILPITADHELIFADAVHFMTTNPLIKVMEVVLFGGLLLHAILGIILQLQNWNARPVRYKVSQKSQVYSPFTRFMIHTGVIIFLFLIIHFMNFYFVKLGWTDPPQGVYPIAGQHDFYNMALNLFANPIYCILYIVLILGLGFHLHHAFQSAFQSLGLNHPTYTPVIKVVGTIYSVLVTLGFISIPLYFLFA